LRGSPSPLAADVKRVWSGDVERPVTARRTPVDPDLARRSGQIGGLPPGIARVDGTPERGAMWRTQGEVERARAGGVDGHGGDIAAGLSGCVEDALGVVVAHGDLLHFAREEARPGLAGIAAAKDAEGIGVDYARVPGVEHEEPHGVAEVDDAPGGAAIVREVGAGHIAGDQRGAAIVRADGGMEDGAAAAGSDDAPLVRARG